MTPDPIGGNVADPQSLNRYSYVLNNPTTLTDPSGLFEECPYGQTNNQCNPAPDNGGIFDLADVIHVVTVDSEADATTSRPVQNPPVSPIKLITWPQLQTLVQENNKFTYPNKPPNFCDDLVDCIVFRESHLGESGVPSGLNAGFNALAGFTVHPALGLMQLEPCIKQGPCVGTYHPFDPGENIRIGSAFLQGKINRLGLQGGVASYGPLHSDYASRILNCLKLLLGGNAGGAYAAATKP